MGKKETLCSANSSVLILMAVSAARPLGSSVLFQVNHEAALLWVSPMVLLLSCESIMVVRGPCSEAAPGQVQTGSQMGKAAVCPCACTGSAHSLCCVPLDYGIGVV